MQVKRGDFWENIEFRRTDGANSDFQVFYQITEDYYSCLVGGEKNRKGFVPFNASAEIPDVLIAYSQGKAVGCAGLKRYDDKSSEIKRGYHIIDNYPPYDKLVGAVCYAKYL